MFFEIDRQVSSVKISLLWFCYMENCNSKVYFILGIHNHQPVGNLPQVFEQAFSKCYQPFLTVLEEFPAIKAVIHNSGALYSWAEKNCPEWIKKLNQLLQRGQIELVSGGFYEPIFPTIRQEDRIGQLELLNQYLEKTFKFKPGGCWVSERVWEPSLAKTLNQCRLLYTYLDEANFCRDDNCQNGLYLTEDQGYQLILFAIDELLSDKLPFISPQKALECLLNRKKDKDVLVTFFSDGEKFGLWPGTHQLVYQQGWLREFFTLLEKNNQIETILSCEAVKKFPKKLVYVGSSSYPQMQSWALGYQKKAAQKELLEFLKENERDIFYRPLLKGGSFKNFFIKYPRLNFMHKRMLWLSKVIYSCGGAKLNRKAILNLWKAQTNCTYWHGLFGGFYLPHLRRACYNYIIKAESFLQQKGLIQEDIDFDGYKELFVYLPEANYIFSHFGATLDELSFKPAGLNLINTVERVKELYHDDADVSFQKYLSYDNYKKTAFVDHFLNPDITIDDFQAAKGMFSLADKPYSLSKSCGQGSQIDFSYCQTGFQLEKSFQISKKGLKTTYCFDEKNTWNNFCFGIECNLAFSGEDNLALEGLGQGKPFFSRPQDLGQVSCLVISDKNYGIKVRLEFDKTRVFINPVYTLTSSEAGCQVLFQQLSLLFLLGRPKGNFSLVWQVSKI